MITPPDMAELRAAWDRCRILRLRGWTFERALTTPMLLWALEKSALAHRRTAALPYQERLL